MSHNISKSQIEWVTTLVSHKMNESQHGGVTLLANHYMSESHMTKHNISDSQISDPQLE